jgi:hypothetical protein
LGRTSIHYELGCRKIFELDFTGAIGLSMRWQDRRNYVRRFSEKALLRASMPTIAHQLLSASTAR